MILSPDPTLKELQLLWEKQFWFKAKASWVWKAKWYEDFMKFFGEERHPRDVFRGDVVEWKEWMKKKGRSNSWISRYCEDGSRFYRFLNDLELVEKDFNPFEGQAPRRIRDK